MYRKASVGALFFSLAIAVLLPTSASARTDGWFFERPLFGPVYVRPAYRAPVEYRAPPEYRMRPEYRVQPGYRVQRENRVRPEYRARPKSTVRTGYPMRAEKKARSEIKRPAREAERLRPPPVRVERPAPPVVASQAPKGEPMVVVSIERQTATLYADGALVARSPVSTGTASHPTPPGVFNVLQKNRHHVSNLYNAKMPYMQRLTWSGIALHEGALPGRPASHGCVRLPHAFADLLWRTTRLRSRVVVARGDAVPVSMAHSTLAVLSTPPVPTPTSPAAASPTASMVAQDIRTRIDADIAALERTAAQTVLPPVSNPFGEPDRRKGRVSVLVSRKTSRLYVRQDGKPLFDTPVAIRSPETAIGTHVFTAVGADTGEAQRWIALTVSARPPAASAALASGRRIVRDSRSAAHAVMASKASPTAGEALDRIDLPPAVASYVAALLSPGASLIVSDQGMSSETGPATDFVLLTP